LALTPKSFFQELQRYAAPLPTAKAVMSRIRQALHENMARLQLGRLCI